MSLNAEDIKTKLVKELEAVHVQVDDISPDMCGTSFHAIIVSPMFVGKSRLAQQRMVNSALAEEIPNIHAFTQKCYTPEAWEKLPKS